MVSVSSVLPTNIMTTHIHRVQLHVHIVLIIVQAFKDPQVLSNVCVTRAHFAQQIVMVQPVYHALLTHLAKTAFVNHVE